MTQTNLDATLLRPFDPEKYVSQSKGETLVSEMHTAHLINAKKALLRKWGAWRAGIALAAAYITSKHGDISGNNLSRS